MDRIDGENVEVVDGKRMFREEDATQIPPLKPTEFTKPWTNGVQEELLAIIEAGGLDPDAEDMTQVLQVIQKWLGERDGRNNISEQQIGYMVNPTAGVYTSISEVDLDVSSTGRSMDTRGFGWSIYNKTLQHPTVPVNVSYKSYGLIVSGSSSEPGQVLRIILDSRAYWGYSIQQESDSCYFMSKAKVLNRKTNPITVLARHIQLENGSFCAVEKTASKQSTPTLASDDVASGVAYSVYDFTEDKFGGIGGEEETASRFSSMYVDVTIANAGDFDFIISFADTFKVSTLGNEEYIPPLNRLAVVDNHLCDFKEWQNAMNTWKSERTINDESVSIVDYGHTMCSVLNVADRTGTDMKTMTFDVVLYESYSPYERLPADATLQIQGGTKLKGYPTDSHTLTEFGINASGSDSYPRWVVNSMFAYGTTAGDDPHARKYLKANISVELGEDWFSIGGEYYEVLFGDFVWSLDT